MDKKARFFVGRAVSRAAATGSQVLLFVFLLGSFLSLGVPRSGQAQDAARPLFDAVTLSAGLNVYQGDLDSNAGQNLIKYLGSGRLSVLVGAERDYGALSVGPELGYDRLWGRTDDVGFAAHAVSLQATAKYGLPIGPSDLVSLFAGAGPTLVIPQFYDFPEGVNGRFREPGTRVVASFVVGLEIQQRIRLGTRITSTDYLDGYIGIEGIEGRDYISYILLSYRLNFSN